MSIKQLLRDNLDILKPAGALLLGLLGTCYVPSALERAKLKQSVYESINASMENLTSHNSTSRRDVAISGLNYLLNSPELGRGGGTELLEDICCAIFGDYEYAGDARGIMMLLKKNGMPIERHAHRLSKYALVIDGMDMRGGIDSDFVYKQGEDIGKRQRNLIEISQHISAAKIYYDRVVYILKNRTEELNSPKEQKWIQLLRERIGRLLSDLRYVVHVDDTPMWISRYEVRFYHDADRDFAGVLRTHVESLLATTSEGKDRSCVLKDYSLHGQGKMLPVGVVEVTMPLPPRGKAVPSSFIARQ